jgi:hypothetical protein
VRSARGSEVGRALRARLAPRWAVRSARGYAPRWAVRSARGYAPRWAVRSARGIGYARHATTRPLPPAERPAHLGRRVHETEVRPLV